MRKRQKALTMPQKRMATMPERDRPSATKYLEESKRGSVALFNFNG